MSTRCTRSNVRYVAAWPRCVESYGVMPQTYIVASGPGRTGLTCASAVSWSFSGTGAPGTVGMEGFGHDCMRNTIPPVVTTAFRGPAPSCARPPPELSDGGLRDPPGARNRGPAVRCFVLVTA